MKKARRQRSRPQKKAAPIGAEPAHQRRPTPIRKRLKDEPADLGVTEMIKWGRLQLSERR